VLLRVRRLRYNFDIWRGVEQAYETRARRNCIDTGHLSQCVCRRLVCADVVGTVGQARRYRCSAQCFYAGIVTSANFVGSRYDIVFDAVCTSVRLSVSPGAS